MVERVDPRALVDQVRGQKNFWVLNTDTSHHEILEYYLNSSPNNWVVVTDALAVEVAGANNLENFKKNWAIVAKHPMQTVVARSVGELAKIPIRQLSDLLDAKRSAEFHNFYCEVRTLQAGSALADQLEEQIRTVRAEHAAESIGNVALARSHMEAHERSLNPHDAKELRALRPIRAGATEMIIQSIIDYAKLCSDNIPGAFAPKGWGESLTSFLMAYSTCLHACYHLRMRSGSTPNLADKYFAADLHDCVFNAYALFAGGLIADDQLQIDSLISATKWRILLGHLAKGGSLPKKWPPTRGGKSTS